MKTQIFISAVLLIFLNSSSFGQIELKMLSPKSMKQDLKNLLETIDAHPDPFAKISENEFQEIIKNVEQSISKELDEIDFYKNLSKIVASLGDGHSSLHMPSLWLKTVRKKYGVFPYDVFLTNNNELFVINTYGDKQIALGAQIIRNF